jgi:hypothetical protein
VTKSATIGLDYGIVTSAPPAEPSKAYRKSCVSSRARPRCLTEGPAGCCDNSDRIASS